MTDPSSVDALRDLDKRGERERQHGHIHSFLLAHGNMTSAEYYRDTGMNTGKKAITQSRARFTELYYEGKLDKLPRRACQVTGHKVTVWHARPAPWTPREHPITRKQALKRMCMAIQEQAREHAAREEAEREIARFNGQIAELKAEVSSLTGVQKKYCP